MGGRVELRRLQEGLSHANGFVRLWHSLQDDRWPASPSSAFADSTDADMLAGMTKRERDLLAIRFVEIEAELQALAEGRVVEAHRTRWRRRYWRSRTSWNTGLVQTTSSGEMQTDGRPA